MAQKKEDLLKIERDIKQQRESSPSSQIEGSTAVIMRNLGIATASQAKGIYAAMGNDMPLSNVSHTKVDSQRLESPGNSLTGSAAQEAAVAELVSFMAPGASEVLVMAASQELAERKNNEEEGVEMHNDATPTWKAPSPFDTTLRRK